MFNCLRPYSLNRPVAIKIITEVDALKASIVELTATIAESQQKEQDALVECTRIQKEMDEFKNNRGAKLDQIKVCPLQPLDFCSS